MGEREDKIMESLKSIIRVEGLALGKNRVRQLIEWLCEWNGDSTPEELRDQLSEAEEAFELSERGNTTIIGALESSIEGIEEHLSDLKEALDENG